MQQRNELDVLKEELTNQQEKNNLLAGELESLRVTVSRLAAVLEGAIAKVGTPNYVAPKSACAGTTIDEGTIRKWCVKGLIDCDKIDGRWYVDIAGSRTQTRLALYRI